MSNWLLIKEILEGLFRLHWFLFQISTSIHFHSLHFLAEISHILHIPFIKILNQLLLSLAPLCAYSGTYTIPEFYFFTCNIPYFKSFFTYLVYFCWILYIVDTMFLQVWIMISIKYIGIFFPDNSFLRSQLYLVEA